MKQNDPLIKFIDENLPLWKDLDGDTKLLNFAELITYLPLIIRWNIRLSNSIMNNKIKFDKIADLAQELSDGKCVWRRLSQKTFMSYRNLPKTLEKRENKKNKFYGKDLLKNKFNIHHLRLNNEDSNTKIEIFDQEVHFVKQEEDESLFVMFDNKYHIAYFLDIYSHKDLYKYPELLQTIFESKFPIPFIITNLPAADPKHDISNEQIKNLLSSAVNLLFSIEDKVLNKRYAISSLNTTTTAGYTTRTMAVFEALNNQDKSVSLSSDLRYHNQLFNEFYTLNIRK